MFEERKYIVIPASEVESIDFAEVMETSPDTCRYSVNGEKTFVKYEGEIPESIANIQGRSEEYSHTEILELLGTEEWTEPTSEEENGD